MTGMDFMGGATEVTPGITSMPYIVGNPSGDATYQPGVDPRDSMINRLLNLVLNLVGMMSGRLGNSNLPLVGGNCECQSTSSEGSGESKSGGFASRIMNLFGKFSDVIGSVKEGWSKGEGFFGLMREGWNGIKNYAKPLVEGFGGILSAPLRGIGNIFKGGIDLIKGFF